MIKFLAKTIEIAIRGFIDVAFVLGASWSIANYESGKVRAELATVRAQQVQQQQQTVKLQDLAQHQAKLLEGLTRFTAMLSQEFDDLQKAKPESSGGWVDCWTSNGKRNCIDAQGNTSSRNF